MTSKQTEVLRKGDVRRVRPHGDAEGKPRLALLMSGWDDGPGFVQVVLAHERPEMAGPLDVVLHPDVDRLPNGLVVQTVVCGGIWPTQCSDLIVRLTPEEMRSVREVVSAGIRSSRDSCHGIQEQELSPEREAFLRSEFEFLRCLIADCFDAVVDDGDPWRIDPGLFAATLLERHKHPDVLLASLGHAMRTRRVTAALHDVATLQACVLPGRCDANGAHYGEDLVSDIASGVGRLIESALLNEPCDGPSECGDSLTYEAPNRLSVAEPLRLRASTRLITAPHLWTDHGDRLIHLAESGCLAKFGLGDSSHACEGGCFDIEVMMLTYGHYNTRAPSLA